MSHHATEDLAILRALPDICLVAPATNWEAGEATKALINHDGVGYLRLDKTVADDNNNFSFTLGQSIRYKKGDDITILSTGGILRDVLHATKLLKDSGIDAGAVNIHTIKPIDKNLIISVANETGGIITVEEHNLDGGLGSAVAEVCMDTGIKPKVFLRIGLENKYSSVVGSQNFLKKYYQMDAENIANRVKNLLS